MRRIAFIFPGQGAQYIGMGQDFYNQIPVCKQVMEDAGNITGLDIPKLCFTENEKLNITEYTQIAMLAVSAAILEALKQEGINSCANAGLSLGEYGAIISSGVMSAADAFAVVRKRGIYMQEAVPAGGAMAAVLGMDAEKIEEICADTAGIVSVANYNCPGQIVITGETDAVKKAGDTLTKEGAKRILPLKVSGPFHSSLLKNAGEKLAEILADTKIHDPIVPYVSNVTAEYVTQGSQVKDLLVRQVYSPVKWQQSVEKMIETGIDTFIEIGAGKTLSGFVRKINRNVTMMNIENIEDFQKVTQKLKG